MIYTNINANMYKQYHTSYIIQIYIYIWFPIFEYNQYQHWNNFKFTLWKRSYPSPATPKIQSGRVSASMVLRIHWPQRHPQNIQILKTIQPWNQTMLWMRHGCYGSRRSIYWSKKKTMWHVPTKKCCEEFDRKNVYTYNFWSDIIWLCGWGTKEAARVSFGKVIISPSAGLSKVPVGPRRILDKCQFQRGKIHLYCIVP